MVWSGTITLSGRSVLCPSLWAQRALGIPVSTRPFPQGAEDVSMSFLHSDRPGWSADCWCRLLSFRSPILKTRGQTKKHGHGLWWALLSTKYYASMPHPTQETKNICHRPSDPPKVLELHHWEHRDLLHHCLVWQLLGIRLHGATEGSAYGAVHHWSQAPCHPGP
jgi:hypothetical protein